MNQWSIFKLCPRNLVKLPQERSSIRRFQSEIRNNTPGDLCNWRSWTGRNSLSHYYWSACCWVLWTCSAFFLKPLARAAELCDAVPKGACFANFGQFIFQKFDKIWRFFAQKCIFKTRHLAFFYLQMEFKMKKMSFFIAKMHPYFLPAVQPSVPLLVHSQLSFRSG